MQIDFDHVFQSNKKGKTQQSPFTTINSTFQSSNIANSHKKYDGSDQFKHEHEHEHEEGSESKLGWLNKTNNYSDDCKKKTAMSLLQNKFGEEDEQIGRSYQWYKKSNGDEKIVKQSQRNGYSKDDVNRITDRLFKRKKCSKEECMKMFETKFIEDVKNKNLPYPNKNQKKTLAEVSQLYKKNPKSEVHERLYREHLQKQFRDYELINDRNEEFDESNRTKNYENPAYLTKYVHFYERLNKEVDLYFKKQEYYQKLTGVQKSDSKYGVFYPNIQASQKSLTMISKQPKIKPKTQKNQLKGTAQMKELLQPFRVTDNDLKISARKNENIFKEKEEEFILRICDIFQVDGEFMASPDAIGELDQKQFQVIFPFVYSIEESEESISIQKFEKQLRKYYETLPLVEKRTIRQQQKLTARRNCCTQRHLTEPTVHENPIMNKTSRKKVKNTSKGDYLRKIQNFV